MKKIKIFLAAFAAMFGLGMQAQTWTSPGSDPVSGSTYFILNIEAGRFVTAANSWGTQMSITGTNDGLPIEAVEVNNVTVGGASLSGWELKNKNNSDKFLFRDDQNWGYTDKGTQDKGYVWNITKKDGVYRLQTATGDPAYPAAELQYAGGNNSLSDGRVYFGYNSSSRDIDWLFLTEAQKNSTNLVARAKLYRALMKAYAAGVNTDAASAVYENSESTEQELLNQVETLDEARYQAHLANASDSDPRDITEFVLNNYDFSQMDISGWETNYVSGTQAQNIGYQSNNAFNTSSAFCNRFIEAWISSSSSIGDGYLRQTVSGLPEGKYKLECDAIAVNQSNASGTTTGTLLFITADGSDYTTSLSTGNNTPEHFSTQFLFTGEGDIIFGLKTVNTTANWIAADNFKVTFYGIDLSAYTTQLASEVSSFEGYENDIEATVYASLQKQVDALNKTYTTSKAYAEAIANMQIINAYAAAYAAATTAKASNGNVTGTELTELNAAIADVPTFNDYDTYAAKTSSLTTKTSTFIAAAPAYNAYVDYRAETVTLFGEELAATVAAPTTAAEAIDAVNNLKVAQYNYVVANYTTAIKLGDWTQEGGTKFNYGKQHWSGDDSQGYWEQTTENYLSSNWSISFNQTIELPAGNYVFKVAGRHSGSSKMALEVTNADTDEPIGSVNDFPTGDTGKGIATDGTANFTDGTFANNGNGRGWQWRYVPFTLEGTTNVTVAVTASAAVQYQWISFCNYTVQAIPNAAVSIIAYNQALDEAKAARDNDAYANVTGSERTALLAAIASDETLDKSDKDKIDAAKDELVSAMTAFINAKAAYDTYAEAKAKVYEELPYASPEKYAAIATAQEATATSAADATDKTSVIISAYRKYVESNALAEGVAGAENKTSLISDPNMEVTYDGTAHTFGAWQVFGQTNGSIQLLSSESFTDGEGNSNYKYADIYKSDNNAGIQQTLSDLAPGRYILTVTARANTTAGASFKIFAGAANAEIQRIGNSGGVFNRGWNDATLVFDVLTESDVNIGVQSGNGKDLWWSATRFRLARLGNVPVSIDENVDYAATEATSVDVTLARTIKADAWNTFVVPFDITNAELKAAFGNDVEVAEFSDGGASADAVTVSFTKMGTPAITANKPVLLKSSTAGTSYSFTNRSVATGTTTIAGTYVDFVGTYNASTTITEGNYFISGNKLWKSSGATTINGTRAYIDAKNVASVRLFIDDVETGIEAINGVEAEDGAIYNIAGQRLGKMQKGINIVNGKKIIK